MRPRLPRPLLPRLRLPRPLLAAMLLGSTIAGTAAEFSTAQYTSSAEVQTTTLSAGDWSGPETYFLHNRPTPPSGDTNRQPDLDADPVAPTAATLYRYNADCPSARPGRTLASTNGAPASCRTVNWLTPVEPSPRSIDGAVVLTGYFWLDSDPGGKNIVVDVALNDLDPATGARASIYALSGITWPSPGVTAPSRALHAISMPVSGYTLPSGHRLEVVVRGNLSTFAQRNVVVAYDTTSYPATLALP